jgi:PiT family inorganic phosphate transporter
MGFAGGFVLLVAVYWSFFRVSRSKAMPWFKNLQRVSAAYMAFSHGRNDAQKPMGILALTLALYWGRNEVAVVSCALVAALGTAYGGWRIIHTVGSRVAGLDPVQGFAAEFAGASVLQLASEFGIPISTTHAITSSIVGVGVVRRRAAVHWLVVRDIVFSWIITVPIATLWVQFSNGSCNRGPHASSSRSHLSALRFRPYRERDPYSFIWPQRATLSIDA